jgi:hypothetical protein
MKKKTTQRARAIERRKQDLNEELRATARKLVDLFEQRFGLDGVDWIFVEHAWIGARYCDCSSGSLLQYRPDRRMGE